MGQREGADEETMLMEIKVQNRYYTDDASAVELWNVLHGSIVAAVLLLNTFTIINWPIDPPRRD
jgi:hypothetical protein